MTQLLPFFIILLAALIFSALSYKLHLPWVVALILGGMVIGPDGIDILQPNDIFEFLGQIGLIFLMFMAGLETRISNFKDSGGKVAVLGLFNGIFPFLVGLSLGKAFGYSWSQSLLIGIIFISSSIAIIIPSLQSSKLLSYKIGRIVVTAAMIEDVVSLILVSVFLQTTNRLAAIPLYVFYPLLLAILWTARWAAPKLKDFFTSLPEISQQDVFQRDVRTLLTLLIGVVVMFEVLGLHAIIAGFFAGFILSDSVKSDVLLAKLRALSYGLFIPVFFVLVGMKTDLSVLINSRNTAWFVGAIVVGSVLAKFISGYFAGRLSGFSKAESGFIGSSTIPQLSTTLAAAFTGSQLGLLDAKLVTAIIALSVATTFLGPVLSSRFAQIIDKAEQVIA